MFIGAYAINPVNQERIPIWIADYVLMDTALAPSWRCQPMTNAILPSRRNFTLPIRMVIAPPDHDPPHRLPRPIRQPEAGVMVNSGAFDNTPVQEAVPKVVAWLEERGLGTGR